MGNTVMSLHGMPWLYLLSAQTLKWASLCHAHLREISLCCPSLAKPEQEGNKYWVCSAEEEWFPVQKMIIKLSSTKGRFLPKSLVFVGLIIGIPSSCEKMSLVDKTKVYRLLIKSINFQGVRGLKSNFLHIWEGDPDTVFYPYHIPRKCHKQNLKLENVFKRIHEYD